jgi:putative ABC transport system ATP-binding protein
VWRNSRREQIIVLLVILASIPFYFASFDVPKRIVNDAIQGRAFKDGQPTAILFDWTIKLPEFLGGHSFVVSEGWAFGQLGHLFALSLLFLTLVLINGGFKYVINVRKGILGERMLRRLRYDLFSQLMRFRPEDVRAVKPAEAASMIKDEVEPIGAFVGDAFIQPAFLGTQALTALAFIMIQNLWLGMIALVIVLIQAVIIPYLRREQLRLGRERQVASRRLAGRIGEIVDAAPAIQGHGAAAYVQSDIAGRLGKLFDIRFALYRRKFAVKFLNNLLAQITPFFFYAVGGYFALSGSLDIGQLVAVIAAYRDLPPPIKELIDWDQQRADVNIKYEQVRSQFSPTEVLTLEDDGPELRLAPEGQIRVEQLQVHDNRGHVVLEPISFVVPRPSFVALLGPAGSGRDVLGRVLGRQTTSYGGKVNLDGHELSTLSVEAASRLIGYAGEDIEILQGSLRDNLTLSLKRQRPMLPEGFANPKVRRIIMEAVRSGNTPLPYDADWTDYAAAQVAIPADLDLAIRGILEVLGLHCDVYDLGLNGRLFANGDSDTNQRFIEARAVVANELRAVDLKGLVETFDPARYNSNASISENFVFGAVKSERLSNENLFNDPFASTILRVEALIEPLLSIGARIASTLAEIFSGLPPGHQLFDRYAFAHALDLEEINVLAAGIDKRDAGAPHPLDVQQQLATLAFGYVESKHRLGLADEPFRQRLLRARASFRQFLPRSYVNDLEFYDPSRVIHGATVRDNVLFGRVGYAIPDAAARVSRIIEAALVQSGLDREVYRMGLDTDTGVNGRHLSTRLRLAVPMVRALVKRPDIYVLDLTPVLTVVGDHGALMTRLRQHCAGKTLIALLSHDSLARDADLTVEFSGNRGQVRSGSPPRFRQEGESARRRESVREPADIGGAP